MKKIKVGSDFSGVGAFNQALLRLGIKYDEIFACDMDKYARQTFELNYGPIKYFPKDVYEREIPKESLDIYMTSPPCQSFSMAGKRQGKDDEKGRGILFFNSLEFIRENKPRYFIFENVKGLLSHDKTDKKKEYGNTFQEWINYLGGKSVNGVHTFFPYEDSVPYHIYFDVLNAKDFNIPQNRERVFIIGIRDDEDNSFQFPKPMPLEKRLKDVLETEVDEKYFLSEKMLESITYDKKSNGEVANLNKGGERGSVYSEETDAISCLSATDYKQPKQIQIGTWRTHEDGKGFREMEDELCPTIPARAREDGSGQPVIKMIGYTRDEKGKVVSRHEKDIAGTLHTASGGGGSTDQFVKIPSNTQKGFDVAEEEEDSINFSVPNSKTRRGRVGKKVSQTLDTQCNQGIFTQQRIRRLTPLECFRLMDFNFGIPGVKDFVWDVSDSQAYKQAGNSIAVGVLAAIIERLKL